MSGVTGKPRQERLHVLLIAAKSHKKRLGCGHIVDTLITISTLQRVIGWNEPDAVKVLNGALKAGTPRKHRQQRDNAPLKTSKQAPSARMTKPERDRVAKNSFRFSS